MTVPDQGSIRASGEARAKRLLRQAGFAFDSPAGPLCASRPFGRFDRYVLAADSLT